MPANFRSFYLLVFLILSLPALAGEVHVSDGDSLRIDGERIQLWGIDASELGQKCKRQGVTFDCGIKVRKPLPIPAAISAVRSGWMVIFWEIASMLYSRSKAAFQLSLQ